MRAGFFIYRTCGCIFGYSVTMARPQKYSSEQIIAALTATKGLVYMAANNLGCDPDTIYYRARRCPLIRKHIRKQRAAVVDLAETRLADAIDNREPWAIALLLRTRGRKRGYVEQREIKHSGSVKLIVKERVVSARSHRENSRPLPGPG